MEYEKHIKQHETSKNLCVMKILAKNFKFFYVKKNQNEKITWIMK